MTKSAMMCDGDATDQFFLSSQDEDDIKHLIGAAENASRDADALVSKLATAGLTVTVAAGGLLEAASRSVLTAAAFGFGLALIISLLGQRAGADSLRVLTEKSYKIGPVAARKEMDGRFRLLSIVNWVTSLVLASAFILLMVGCLPLFVGPTQ